MTSDLLPLGLVALTLVAYAISIVYVIGIVWRVELQLDLSYKLFSGAVILLLLGEIIDAVPHAANADLWFAILRFTRFLAAICLFFGMYYMRDLVRKIDGEKRP